MIKVAFFDAKAYDKPSFEHYGEIHDVEFRFLETKLNEDTVELAKGCDAVRGYEISCRGSLKKGNLYGLWS